MENARACAADTYTNETLARICRIACALRSEYPGPRYFPAVAGPIGATITEDFPETVPQQRTEATHAGILCRTVYMQSECDTLSVGGGLSQSPASL